MEIGFLLSNKTRQSDLIKGLKDKGCIVSTIEIPLPFNASSMMNLSEFIHTGTYDVIHNAAGMFPLVFSPGIKSPILTIIDNYLTDEDLQLLKHHSSACYFASSLMSLIPDFLLDKAFPVTGTDIAGSFYSIYESMLKDSERIDRRPWGFYEVLSDMPDHKVKRITVAPGKRLSLQSHKKRSEHWIVIAGTGVVTLNGTDHVLTKGDSIDIATGAAHRMSNPYDSPLAFIEVQMGDYFGEDDIIRLEDDFGRI